MQAARKLSRHNSQRRVVIERPPRQNHPPFPLPIQTIKEEVLNDSLPQTQDLQDFDVNMVSQGEEEYSVTQIETWGALYVQKMIKRHLGSQRGRVLQNVPSETFFNLSGSSVKIGRDRSCFITLNEKIIVTHRILERLSKVQFTLMKDLSCDKGKRSPTIITDNSTNGTFINGERLGKNKSRILVHGDKIAFIDPVMTFFEYRQIVQLDKIDLPRNVSLRYFADSTLGSGAFGNVYKARSISSLDTVALKFIESSKTDDQKKIDSAINETKIMKNILHPCIVRLVDLMESTVGHKTNFTLVLEYMGGGDLLHRVLESEHRRLPEDETRFIIYQVCQALKYLHNHDIVHRDVKPENVLLKDSSQYTLAKITDFGLSKLVTGTFMKSILGTPNYVAPEVLRARQIGSYTEKVDVWSLGVVLYACISGNLPFSGDKDTPVEQQVVRGNFGFYGKVWNEASPVVRELIKRMLTVDSEKRISIDQMFAFQWLNRRAHPILDRAKNMMDIESQRIYKEHEQENTPTVQLAKKLRIAD